MKTRILAAIAAFGLGLGAYAATGDIFSITPCDEAGVNLGSAYATYAKPVGAGKEMYFKMVLGAHKANGEYWRLNYTGIGSEKWDEVFNPLQIGIFVSGRLQYASLVAFRKGDMQQTSEMIFKYVTKSGDFAMPILLAANDGADGAAVPVWPDQASDGFYYLNPLTKDDWRITFNNSDTPAATTNIIQCTLQTALAGTFSPPPGSKPALHSDSLSSAGFYVKTIDFSDDAETEEFWRTVHEGSTITGGGVVPKLVIDAAPEVETTVYVWSDDESAVKIKGGRTVSMQINSAGDMADIQVGTVTFKGGQVEAQDFQIEGSLGGENRTANLILSAYDTFHYSLATNDRIKDYLSVKVKCIEPLPPSIVVECDRNTAYANGNYTTYAAVLQVYLSQACVDPVEVTLTPSFTDGTAGDFTQYLRFSTLDTIDEPSFDGSDYNVPTVTIPAGSTGRQTIYLFCLRSDLHTVGNAKIKFSSSTTSAEIEPEHCGSKSINVLADITSIVTPAEGAKIATTCNDEYPFTIAVDDTFADTHDTATGYKIFVKYRASDTFVQLDGVYYVGDGNALYKLDMTDPANPQKTSNLPILKYTASGEGLESEVYVVAPINPNTANAKKSEIRKFVADVKEARTVKVTAFDEDFAAEKRSFDEGDDVGLRITLSEKNETGAPIYAYLKPSANVSADMFACQTYNCVIGMEDPAGLPINNSLDSNEALVSLLDGKAKPGLKITFEVLLSTEPNWDGVDMTKKLSGYDSNYLTITTYNIEPTIKRIEMNGNKSLNDGYTFPNKLPMGQEQRFQIYVTEPGVFDLTNTNEPFQVRWSASLDGQTYDDPKVIEGDPKTTNCLFRYSFPAAGVWKITAEVKDKDMDDWAELDYSVFVTVLDQPALESPDDEVTLPENDLRTWKYSVGLGYFDPKYTGTIKVIVDVGKYSEGKTNPGILKLDSKFLMGAGDASAAIAAAAIPGFEYNANHSYYLVELNKSKLKQDLALEELDGTDNSSIYGFTIVSHVINDDVLPTSGYAAKEYYLESNTTRVMVNNLVPTFGSVTMPNTNAWKVAGGAAIGYPISWQVRNDVKADFDGKIIVEFTGCNNAADGRQEITGPASGKFVPNFGNAQGEQTVTLTITDKDGGSETWTYLYYCEPSKFLKTYAHGPSGGTTSKLSQKYERLRASKDGIGAGHTYANGVTFSRAENFELTWNCSKLTSVDIMGFGYKHSGDAANPTRDNGLLDGGKDIAISASGAATAGIAVADPYLYTEPKGKDSFLYCWILTILDENGAATDTILGETISPEVPAVVGKGSVTLPTDEIEKGGYLDTKVEAIFAKEYLVSDNLGDINQDGIPDVYAVATWADGSESLIQTSTGLPSLEGDTTDISKMNPDEDYLPGVWQRKGEATLRDNAKNSYAPIGHAFTTFREIRGFHEGLNATDITASDPWMSAAESNAYKQAFADAHDGAAWTEADGIDLAFWSPEPRGTANTPRLDPTTDDTDGDGYPDGWEYYFWYLAHVWVIPDVNDPTKVDDAGKPRKGQDYVFERFNPYDIIRGIEIPREEVEERFNPCVKLDTTVKDFTSDFDNDGLTDLEELLIGTNPCHWDTDGDRMCDGWEVLRSLDPLNARSKSGNSDKDFMAFAQFPNEVSIVKEMIIDGMPTEVVVVDINGQLVQGVDYTTSIDLETLNMVVTMNRDVTLRDALILIPKIGPDGEPYNYGLDYETEIASQDGVPLTWHWGYPMADDPGNHLDENYDLMTWRRSADLSAGDTGTLGNEYVLIHDQVHDAFGFDPRTAWNCDTFGYVADRWNPLINTALSPLDTTGAAIYTDYFCDYDEYLVMRYRRDYNITHFDDAKWDMDNIFATFAGYTTNPSINWPVTDIESLLANSTQFTEFESTNLLVTANIADNLAQALSQAGSAKQVSMGHGADTDGDGVPDGWELYVRRNPNAPPSAKTVTEGIASPWDKDGDLLGFTAEYAGTDSCNAYQSCETIYRNHPGNVSGWFNKFFPTDPDDPDSDRDGIGDGQEGMSWTGIFPTSGNVHGFSFIYGEPVDSITCCVRGGGMNPLTVDTDQDGLPDRWEMQYAGVCVNANTKQYVPPSGAGMVDIAFPDSVWIADGILNRQVGSNIVYICGGMDATWGGDAFTDWNSYDPLLGCVRDVDFDFDGLQNAQEFLVQTMRHFRYDDITTPLNGRIMIEGAYDPFTFYLINNHRQKFEGVVTMDSMSPDSIAAMAAMSWNDAEFATDTIEIVTNVTGFTEVINEYNQTVLSQVPVIEVVTNVNGGIVAKFVNSEFSQMFEGGWNAAGWRGAGYFAPPIQRWDRTITAKLLPPYTLCPPTGAAAYVSTDPRSADSDGDGMDDFYEMFHGLNPLLGSTTPGTGDVIASAYGQPLLYNAYWNEWMFPDFSRLAVLAQGLPGTPSRATPLIGPAALDPVLYPWTQGTSEADPDGDGMRNEDERIFANGASPERRHTDPTPLWFTDSSKASSFVSQYYGINQTLSNMPFWPQASALTMAGANAAFLYSFEENEGFDTDNDWLSDGREVVHTVLPPSDPLKESDPVRRQALYLDGVNSYAMTKEPQYRAADGTDLLTQFTAECWVYPERTAAQTILDRSSFYPASADNKDDGAIRANFRIGTKSDGRLYGVFDNSDSVESGLNAPVSSQEVFSDSVLKLGQWSHVAMSFDGKTLKLYVNGQLVDSKSTNLRPANGVVQVNQNPSYTTTFVATTYSSLPCAFFIGARPAKQAVNAFYVVDPVIPGTESFDNVCEFFQGWVDEVRIWDGARTGPEIAGAYRERFTFDDVATNRYEVYQKWIEGATRNDNDGNPELPAELIQHYDFGTLPGAVAAADVAKTPNGFQQAVGDVVDFDPTATDQADTTDVYPNLSELKGGDGFTYGAGIDIGWWGTTALRSQVYDDYRVIPWIENTCAHLPFLDGSVVDSVLYSEQLGGKYTPASKQGIGKFQFPNTAMPFSHYVYNLERWYHDGALNFAVEALGEFAEDLHNKYTWEIRTRFVGTSDLVPLGGAFAKTTVKMWDGQGASDAWETTREDTDGDGLPDWWEEIAAGYSPEGDPIDWNTMVTYEGRRIPAYEAYLRDLAKGMQPDGSIAKDYRATADADGDGLVDWWERLYDVKNGSDDSDGDGLSNYVEYMLSEAFDFRDGGERIAFDPTNPYSVNDDVSDYFYRLGQLYVGEIFADHDHMSDQWELKYLDKLSPYRYDAGGDPDNDGWSNYAEFQAGTDPTLLGAIGIDMVQIDEYPIPTVELLLDYEGSQAIADVPIVVKAWHDPKLETIPDAVWSVGVIKEATENLDGDTNVVSGVKYIGMNPRKELLFHLSPGSIVKNTVVFEYKDPAWILVDQASGQSWIHDSDSAVWSETLIDRENPDEVGKGWIVDKFNQTNVGTIDYTTGAVSIDLTKVVPYVAIVGDISGGQAAAGQDLVSVYDLSKSYIRVKWGSKPIVGARKSTYYLADADKPSAVNNSLGHLKEGVNTFIAFYDLNGDGKYTAGEPFGAATGVDVGWNYAKVSIELTDTCPVIPRFNTQYGTNDRTVLHGSQSSNLTPENYVAGTVSGGTFERVRIVRTSVDGIGCSTLKMPDRVVLDKMVNINNDSLYITEADIMHDGNMDLDWETLADDLAAGTTAGMQVTNVGYRVVLGNGSVDAGITNNLLNLVFTRAFDSSSAFERNKPVALDNGVVTAVSPTFRWYMPYGFNSYTAFEIVVLNSRGAQVWSSGIVQTPARVIDDRFGWHYEWQAPLYAGDKLLDGTVFANDANYTWTVRMVNARYRYGNNWSDEASFRMNVLTNSVDYGQIDVAVRYYGPDKVRTSGTIRVQAFETPDFSGRPVAQTYVTDLSDVASVDEVVEGNARLIGLKTGTYFLRAFIDTNNDGVCQEWETWGFRCVRDTAEATLYSPKSVKVGPDHGIYELATIYLEDCDTDNDNLPDAWEWAQVGDLETYGVERLDTALKGGIAVSSSLSGKIKDAEGSLPGGLSVRTLASFNNPFVAAMVCNVSPAPGATADEVTESLSAAGDTEIEPDSVAITSIELDRANRQVKIGFTGRLKSSISSPLATAIYDFNAGDVVTCKVYRKDSVPEVWPATPVAVIPGIVLGGADGDILVDVDENVDMTSGYFMITLEK